jgi:hypothetical protein
MEDQGENNAFSDANQNELFTSLVNYDHVSAALDCLLARASDQGREGLSDASSSVRVLSVCCSVVLIYHARTGLVIVSSCNAMDGVLASLQWNICSVP